MLILYRDHRGGLAGTAERPGKVTENPVNRVVYPVVWEICTEGMIGIGVGRGSA